MPNTIIRLEAEREFSIPAAAVGGTPGMLHQSESRAANVLPYAYVNIYIRVRSNPTPTLSITNPLQLFISTAAVLLYRDESSLTGNRFIQNSPAVITFPTAVISGGATLSASAPVASLGGLVTWMLANPDSSEQNFVGDIFLVCRGFA